jgi:hypothetical protein
VAILVLEDTNEKLLLASAGTVVTVSAALLFKAILLSEADTLNAVGAGLDSTWMVSVFLKVVYALCVAVIVAVPSFLAVTTPLAEIVATVALLELHLTVCAAVEGSTVAAKLNVCPMSSF